MPATSASWFGLTPQASTARARARHLGRISKKRRPLPAHAAHPWCPKCAARRQGGLRALGKEVCGHAPMGIGRARPQQSQQGGLRAGQQTGSDLLRHAARQGAVCTRAAVPLTKKVKAARAFRDAGLIEVRTCSSPGTSFTPSHACVEIDRPSWPTGFLPPHRADADNSSGSLPAACSDWRMRCRRFHVGTGRRQSPQQMPDIRLQVLYPLVPNRSGSCC